MPSGCHCSSLHEKEVTAPSAARLCTTSACLDSPGPSHLNASLYSARTCLHSPRPSPASMSTGRPVFVYRSHWLPLRDGSWILPESLGQSRLKYRGLRASGGRQDACCTPLRARCNSLSLPARRRPVTRSTYTFPSRSIDRWLVVCGTIVSSGRTPAYLRRAGCLRLSWHSKNYDQSKTH
ncbi:hypothetical protein OH77DRAFT_1428369 [Trametes cingulata]|nr:hypothetical protein OH77DRAFT_1428369 [Trametes cingulata]